MVQRQIKHYYYYYTQWWSGRSATTHRDCARSALNHLRLWRKLYDCSLHPFTTSQCIPKCCSIYIFNNLQLLIGWNLKCVGLLFGPRFGRLWESGGWGWVPISFPLTHMVYLIPFWELFCSKSVYTRPSDPNTITNRPTALEAAASSSDKNNSKQFNWKE